MIPPHGKDIIAIATLGSSKLLGGTTKACGTCVLTKHSNVTHCLQINLIKIIWIPFFCQCLLKICIDHTYHKVIPIKSWISITTFKINNLHLHLGIVGSSLKRWLAFTLKAKQTDLFKWIINITIPYIQMPDIHFCLEIIMSKWQCILWSPS